MAKYDWETNALEGRALRRVFKQLAEKMKTAESTAEMCEIARAMAYIATAKTTLSKVDWDKIDKRIAALERVAQISEKGVIEP
ncbi:MAG: hypothetical protein ACREAY_01040 [Nitrososphaera sp.]|uniref:hypothetical protein n=1 Tax=Nitrososphaera sp. TaxID=1971748 RepID=UPI003D6F859A